MNNHGFAEASVAFSILLLSFLFIFSTKISAQEFDGSTMGPPPDGMGGWRINTSSKQINDAVMTYKNKLEMLPANIIAGMFHFKPEEFFEASEKEKETPQVKF